MDNDAFLDELLWRKDSVPTSTQALTAIDACMTAVKTFSAQVAASPFSAMMLPVLEQLNSSHCKWLPDYCCVLLVTPSRRLGNSYVVLVFPDQWQVAASRKFDGVPLVATPQGSSVLDVGVLEAKTPAMLFRDIERHLSEANAPMYIKTPYFIQKLSKQALIAKDDQTRTLKYDTWSDSNGTALMGAPPRARSCWPLVDAALSHLAASPHKYCEFRIECFLWLLETLDIKMEQTYLDSVMRLIDVVVVGSLDLEAHRRDISNITARVERVRLVLNTKCNQFMKQKAATFVIDATKTTAYAELPNFTSTIPKRIMLSEEPVTMADIRKRAMANCHALPCFPSGDDMLTTKKFQLALNWIECNGRLKKATRPDAQLLILNSIEGMMWSCAPHLLLSEPSFLSSGEDVVALDMLVLEYSNRLQTWLASDGGKHSMMVKLRSHEVLVSWIAFCLVHRHCGAIHSLVLSYATPLDWHELSNLVLDDKRAMDAALLVAGYIRQMNQSSTKMLFSLVNSVGTIEFSRSFAKEDAGMLTRWHNEEEATERRMTHYMARVRAKQTQAAKLRIELETLATKRNKAVSCLAEAEAAEKRSRQRHSGKSTANKQFIACRQETSRAKMALKIAEQQVSTIEQRIRETIQVPPFVICPLPKTKEKALGVLFFFLIPPDLNILSRLAVAAQYTLVPRPPGNLSSLECIRVPTPLSWAQHYNSYSVETRKIPPAETQHWILYPSQLAIPSHFGPTTVDGIKTAKASFWYPCDTANGVAWSTGLNPFLVVRDKTEEYFTYQLEKSCEQLQWVLRCPIMTQDGDSNRGNLAYANLHEKPTVFTKAGFIALGSIRSFPNQQIRKLIQYVHSRVISLNEDLVLHLFRQAMFHVGALSDADRPTMLWKRDLDQGGLEVWLNVLRNLSEQLRDTPRQHKAFVVAAEMISYVSQFLSTARGLARDLVEIAKEWAQLVHDQSETSSLLPKERLELRAKECLMYGYAIIGQSSAGQFTMADANALVELVVLFRNGVQFGRGSQLEAELMHMEVCVQHAMVRRVDKMMNMFLTGSNQNKCFVRAARGVSERIPTTTKWTQVGDTSCFESSGTVDNKTDHYLVNLLTGTVLVNGTPPGRLPLLVLEHPLYRFYFGNDDFDVVTLSYDGDIVYLTARPCGSVNYEFSLLHESNEVRIRAIDSIQGNGRALQLVLFTKETWPPGLPIRLLKMHSHWVDYESNIMVFCAPSFKNSAISYIATLNEPSRCFEIPLPNQCDRLASLLSSFQSCLYFVDPASAGKLISSLAKFEDPSFIHTLKDLSGALRVHLPRFGLTFVCDTTGRGPRSLEYNGYELAASQQLDSTLPFFQHYLVLEQSLSCRCHPSRLLLVPQGSIFVNAGFAQVNVSDDFDATLAVCTFTVHSNQLSASCIAARLQLAAIFAASSTLLPDQHLMMTGTEAAVNLVRQCWVSRPLTQVESDMLDSVVQFSNNEPVLAIVCAQLVAASQDRAFLHYNLGKETTENASTKDQVVTSTSELRSWMTSSIPWNACRRGLLALEKLDVFCPLPIPRLHILPAGTEIAVLPLPPVAWDFVSKRETNLLSLVTLVPAPKSRPFPMRTISRSDLGEPVTKRLKTSWDHHQGTPTSSLSKSTDATWQNKLDDIREQVDVAHAALEVYLREILEKSIPPSMTLQGKLLHASNRRPCVSMRDWLIMAVDITHISHFNPFLTHDAAALYQRTTRLWLAICVLKSRLGRLCHLAHSKASDALVIQELETTRTWSVDIYPHWLVFEVEGSLQIRPEQTTIALHLLKEPSGTICQLNMGLGKTRVILPMLVLQYVAQGEIPRVHLLSSILHEALDFLHLYLTASTLGIRLVEQPFHRQVELCESDIAILKNTILNACYIVAPEHRLSLEMKYQEWTYEKNPLVPILLSYLNAQRFVDIFDECDALLHHRYQLVYAMGSPTVLDNCEARTGTAHALLAMLNSPEPHSELRKWVGRHGLSNEKKPRGAFRCIRLKVGVSEAHLVELRRLVLEALVAKSPPEFQWLSRMWVNNKDLRAFVMDAIVTKNVSVESIKANMGESTHYIYFLALRGYLGFGLLEYALEQRPRVHYGVDPNRKPKRLAVPFRAADVPANRAEFGHPDIAILFTTLAYYYQGLTELQMMEAVDVLLSLGSPARKRAYASWVTPLLNALREAEKRMLDDVSKLDKSNAKQMKLFVKTFAYSTELINFWLRHCVFARDLTIYPARIATSTWNLAESHHAKGFSGTNESNLILPAQIKPSEPLIPALQGTNGLMLDLLLTYTLACHVLPPSDVLWETLVDFLIVQGYEALVDTGSLLAGISNYAIAEYMLNSPNLQARFRAVVYFDPATNQWIAWHRQTRHIVSLRDSAIKECDACVIFDDARSRGTDMKLKADAVAVLTLGPKLTKDKLMQGAGRMRLLGKGQRVVVVATKEVQDAVKSIVRSGGMTISSVLEWVVDNTTTSIATGLPTWSQQGLEYCQSQESAVTDERVGLVDLFEAPMVAQTLKKAVRHRIKAMGGLEDNPLVERIVDQCNELGANVQVAMAYGEECERELQLEEEKDEEVEIQFPLQTAASEPTWNYASVLTARNVGGVAVKVERLVDAVRRRWLPPSLHAIQWPTTVFGSVHFFKTIEATTTIEFSRVVDMALRFPNGDVLLLSDKEADAVLGLLWGHRGQVSLEKWLMGSMAHVQVANLTMLVAAQDEIGYDTRRSNGSEWMAETAVVMALQVVNGATTFGGGRKKTEREAAVAKMLGTPETRLAVRELVAARGEARNWTDSDLDHLCMMLSVPQ
ncbi:Aste57867_471 [Aphanomyces stellatus]|uniref:ubiquitinyl hydrolase 1 n=1 Tax=Aphanomyces stellatus TaxID=120398 RepID=A0A485K3P6_9STRA|nr:hypothetical protein As57867_000470 [Aphanomyces stellatus]VFT77696.1 Aste57867_471 [Aphanomyces stellatus]